MKARKSSNRKGKELDKNEDVYRKIGKRLKGLRMDAGYSASEYFAYENEIARAQYAKYEQGTDMKISSLLNVLKAYKMSLSEFFEGIE